MIEDGRAPQEARAKIIESLRWNAAPSIIADITYSKSYYEIAEYTGHESAFRKLRERIEEPIVDGVNEWCDHDERVLATTHGWVGDIDNPDLVREFLLEGTK